MRRILAILLCSVPAFAAVSGTVINRTTGKPASGAPVSLYSLQSGFEMIEETRSDAQGGFTFKRDLPGPGLIRTVFEGVTFNQMMQPGSPVAGITVEVYNASTQPGGATVSKHMILLEPAAGQMGVKETFLLSNPGNTAWNNPAGGTVRFFLPEGAGGKVDVKATAPGGLPIDAAIVKTGTANVFGIDFPIKPGETRIDVAYVTPHEEGSPYTGRVVTKDENTYLIVPNGLTLTGEKLNDLGVEPQTQARIYGLEGSTYSVQIAGSVAAAPSAGEAAEAESDGSPQIEPIKPQLFDKVPLILALALAVLALGFAILYRASGNAAKETNERGRR